jgi:hypothetical protein
MILLNIGVVLFFGHLLITKDYTLNPKWMYYMDGLVFAVNFAIVLKYFTDTMWI